MKTAPEIGAAVYLRDKLARHVVVDVPAFDKVVVRRLSGLNEPEGDEIQVGIEDIEPWGRKR